MSATTAQKTVPAYVQFCHALRRRFEAAGIPLVESQGTNLDGLPGPKGFVLFQDPRTEHKMYVPRFAVEAKGPSETTIRVHASNPAFHRDLSGKNGKIESQVKTDLELIASHVIPLFASAAASSQRLRENRAPVRKAATETPAADSEVTSWTASLDSEEADSEVASWTTSKGA